MGNCCSENTEISLEKSTMENTPIFNMLGRTCLVKVIEVYDGDTLTISFPFDGKIYRQRCRIDGVDCAEIRTRNKVEKAFGFEAKNHLEPLLFNHIVQARFNKSDKFGRLLATVWFVQQESGITVDKYMIEQGYGYEYHGGKKRKFEEWFDPLTGRALRK